VNRAPGIEIVDPHIHIWDLATGLYPRREQRRREGDANAVDYLVNDLLHDAGTIRLAKAVHIEAFSTDGLAEAKHVSTIADAAPSGLPQAIIAYADLADPRLDASLRQLTALPRVRGIRQALNRSGETRDLLGEAAWCAGFGLLARHGLSFELQLAPAQAAHAARLIADHPGIPVALNHMGWPKDRDFAGWRAWRGGLRELARLGNVSVKISGPGMFDPSWSVESLKPYAFEALDAFGESRVMFASNFPVDRAWSSYERLWTGFAELTERLSTEQCSRLMRDNAERFYRI
jgi:predicted TIM-barrel fold metal-dependent hydrolase